MHHKFDLIVIGSIGDAKNFDNGRQFEAWLGVVPSQHSSGGNCWSRSPEYAATRQQLVTAAGRMRGKALQ